MSKISVTHEHGELKECVLADYYTPDFWDEWLHLQEPGVDSIRDTFKKISEEILEDFETISNTLGEHGITVHRPDTQTIQDELIDGEMTGQDDNANSTTIMDLMANVDAPMNPGFDLWVYGNNLYTCEEKDIEYGTLFSSLDEEGVQVHRDPHSTSLKKFPFQSVQRLGDSVWADTEELSEAQIETLQGIIGDAELILEPDNGHNFVKWINPWLLHYSGHPEDKGPNACTDIARIYSHGQTSRVWLRETKNITDMGDFVDSAIAEMLKMNENKWWLDRYIETGDDKILGEVDAFLKYWANFTDGVSPFEQDGVALNHSTYMTIGSDPDQVAQLKEHNVDVVSVPFRHKFLWGHSLRGYIADLVRT